MKPSEIELGKLYIHKEYPDTIYIGVRKDKKHKEKDLFIIKNANNNLNGFYVRHPSDCQPDFWNGFKKIDTCFDECSTNEAFRKYQNVIS